MASFNVYGKKVFRLRPVIFLISLAALTCALMVLYEIEKLQTENAVRQSIRIQDCVKYPTKYRYHLGFQLYQGYTPVSPKLT